MRCTSNKTFSSSQVSFQLTLSGEETEGQEESEKKRNLGVSLSDEGEII